MSIPSYQGTDAEFPYIAVSTSPVVGEAQHDQTAAFACNAALTWSWCLVVTFVCASNALPKCSKTAQFAEQQSHRWSGYMHPEICQCQHAMLKHATNKLNCDLCHVRQKTTFLCLKLVGTAFRKTKQETYLRVHARHVLWI